jgi:hypothetical protein
LVRSIRRFTKEDEEAGQKSPQNFATENSKFNNYHLQLRYLFGKVAAEKIPKA